MQNIYQPQFVFCLGRNDFGLAITSIEKPLMSMPTFVTVLSQAQQLPFNLFSIIIINIEDK
jgi:hypothetical protein